MISGGDNRTRICDLSRVRPALKKPLFIVSQVDDKYLIPILPPNLPRKSFFDGFYQLIRAIIYNMGIDVQRHFNITMSSQVLDFFNIHVGLTQSSYVGMPELVRRDPEIQCPFDLGPSGLFLVLLA